jgi:hypothetical protein
MDRARRARLDEASGAGLDVWKALHAESAKGISRLRMGLDMMFLGRTRIAFIGLEFVEKPRRTQVVQ